MANDSDNSLHATNLVCLCTRLACVHFARGDLAAARTACQRCRAYIRSAGDRCMTYAQTEAMLLLPLAEFRDLNRTNQILSKVPPGRPSELDGIARYRNGDYAAGIQIAEDSKYKVDLLVRSACLAKLGQIAEARRAYAEAVPQLESSPVLDAMFRAFQMEVEELVKSGR